jgi:hypothetical protein
MNKKIDRRSIDGIKWSNVPHNKSAQKLAIKDAVKKVGNSRKLSIKSNVSAQTITNIVNFECDSDGKYNKNTDVTTPKTGIKLENGAKIKGLAKRLCPSLKKLK